MHFKDVLDGEIFSHKSFILSVLLAYCARETQLHIDLLLLAM